MARARGGRGAQQRPRVRPLLAARGPRGPSPPRRPTHAADRRASQRTRVGPHRPAFCQGAQRSCACWRRGSAVSVSSGTLADWLLGDTADDQAVALPDGRSYGWLRARVNELATELVARHGHEGSVLLHAPRTTEGVVGVLAVIA